MNTRIAQLARSIGVHPDVARGAVADLEQFERARLDRNALDNLDANKLAVEEMGARMDVTERSDRWDGGH